MKNYFDNINEKLKKQIEIEEIQIVDNEGNYSNRINSEIITLDCTS